MESKKEKFKRLAEARTNKIIDMLDLLGNCANKSNYEYTDDEVRVIFTAIENAVKVTKMKFTDKQKKNKFKL